MKEPIRPAPGRFIVLEGIDGSGKTTQTKALAAWLPQSGLLPPGAEVICTREPGGTALGQEVRRLLLHPPDGIAPCPTAELLLYAADRAQHVETVIRPALAAGHWVVSDRFIASTWAYQGAGRGLPLPTVVSSLQIATGGLVPDLILWLDLPVKEALRRRGRGTADRIEGSGEVFLQRVVKAYRTQAGGRPSWERVDATQSVWEVEATCQAILRERFGQP